MLQDDLFHKYELSDIFTNHVQNAYDEIDALGSDRLLSTPIDDLVDYFLQEYKIEPITLLEDHIYIDQTETKLDVSHDHSRSIYDRSKPVFIDGTRITYSLPYTGDRELFNCRPSTFNFSPPRAIISHDEIQLIFDRLDHNAEKVKSDFESAYRNLKGYLDWIENDVTQFNNQLKPKFQEHLEKRRKKILNDRGLAASLGYPLRKRDNAPTTFNAQIVRKKINAFPTTPAAPFLPEPVLEMEEYEQILSIISNMVLVMERSLNAFRTMQEESLRQHILVQLNGQYEGQATGETFNYQGKTDILIRVNNKNIFIAECKFWKGEKVFLETINQLLGYTSWRDSKTALLIFNRNKKFSNVVKSIPETVKKHPNYKRQLTYNKETSSRYIFKHYDDPNRELILTVLTFDVPGND